MPGMLKEEVLENRELRDLMDRVIDKGIVLDPADRIGLAVQERLGGDHIIVGTLDTQVGKNAA